MMKIAFIILAILIVGFVTFIFLVAGIETWLKSVDG